MAESARYKYNLASDDKHAHTSQVIDKDIPLLVKELRAALDIKKTENACKNGLDPHNLGVVYLNTCVDWLGRMHYLADLPPM